MSALLPPFPSRLLSTENQNSSTERNAGVPCLGICGDTMCSQNNTLMLWEGMWTQVTTTCLVSSYIPFWFCLLFHFSVSCCRRCRLVVVFPSVHAFLHMISCARCMPLDADVWIYQCASGGGCIHFTGRIPCEATGNAIKIKDQGFHLPSGETRW